MSDSLTADIFKVLHAFNLTFEQNGSRGEFLRGTRIIVSATHGVSNATSAVHDLLVKSDAWLNFLTEFPNPVGDKPHAEDILKIKLRQGIFKLRDIESKLEGDNSFKGLINKFLTEFDAGASECAGTLVTIAERYARSKPESVNVQDIKFPLKLIADAVSGLKPKLGTSLFSTGESALISHLEVPKMVASHRA